MPRNEDRRNSDKAGADLELIREAYSALSQLEDEHLPPALVWLNDRLQSDLEKRRIASAEAGKAKRRASH